MESVWVKLLSSLCLTVVGLIPTWVYLLISSVAKTKSLLESSSIIHTVFFSMYGLEQFFCALMSIYLAAAFWQDEPIRYPHDLD